MSYTIFLDTIYKHCSTEVTTRVIETEWKRKQWVNLKDQAIPRITFFAQLLSICSDTTNQSKMDKIEQISHFRNF